MQQTVGENMTRAKLIEAGTWLFAEHNGHEVSNRRLAAEAKVNHAMINYHFGSREGLLDAIFSHCLQKWKEIILPLLEAAETRIGGGKDALAAAVRELVDGVIAAITGKQSGRFLAVLLNDDLTTPKKYYDRLFNEVLAPFHRTASRIAAEAKGLKPEAFESLVLGQAIVAQCMTFFRGRVLLLPRLKWPDLEGDKHLLISRPLGDAIVASLGL
ncbi:transcriptional regulator, TetR family [Humidesulfovibrio mexicanus]|uniref:Transcriptional regulator, TetR family n=1 Tax=Humidesulfovibrio mexicanus TaxID=147047 RepID=A0A239BKI3_9BACT|nr:CerR family C-terminal domain-containing protein [Humidesulfovibrio mexicanus]SNS07553.1 transcriptional regulator, TetR family [Humidesulfovibrio mexicanus]